MITERLTFQAKYGQGDALTAVMKEAPGLLMEGVSGQRIYTDFTGTMFTVALEIDYADFETYAKATLQQASDYADPAFGTWFARMVAVTESGNRQLWNSERMM